MTEPLKIPFETHLEVEREARFLGTPENAAIGLGGNLQGLLSKNVCAKQEVSNSIHTTFKVHFSSSETQIAILQIAAMSCVFQIFEHLNAL